MKIVWILFVFAFTVVGCKSSTTPRARQSPTVIVSTETAPTKVATRQPILGRVATAHIESVTLRIEINPAFFDAQLGRVCTGGWTIVVRSPAGYTHESNPGSYYQEAIPGNWPIYGAVDVVCGLHTSASPFFATWSSSTDNRGFRSMSIDGRDVRNRLQASRARAHQ